ncbi:MAG TPA: phosphotransferase [Clostridia bacterium]|nr:phosphotransferase [Clostridia bacterium]
MPENVMEHIVTELRQTGAQYYPEHGELRNVRVVGHTPKSDHYIYDIVIDFADGAERLAAKVYRASKCGARGSKDMASVETRNLRKVYDTFRKKNLAGVPRPVGEFVEFGAVVAEKLGGMPLQSIIMKAALLPGYADLGTLHAAARHAGEWLRRFHKATADLPAPFDGVTLLRELEKLCANCKGSGLDEASVRMILSGTKSILSKTRKALPTSAVLNDFSPLNIVLGEKGVGFSDFANMAERGTSYSDVASFLASVEALEKYPFCNRSITTEVQESFLEAYGVTPAEQQILRVLKMQALLSMFAQGRNVKESAVRKKVMWATVMKRFIQQAAERSLAPAA